MSQGLEYKVVETSIVTEEELTSGKRCRRALCVAALIAALHGLAAPALAELSVARQVFARGVEAREPVGVATAFPSEVERLYFFTQILGAEGPTDILHVWIYDGQEVAIFPLTVEATSWRTWSVQTIRPEQRGDWTVEVREVNGKVLQSASCRIQ